MIYTQEEAIKLQDSIKPMFPLDDGEEYLRCVHCGMLVSVTDAMDDSDYYLDSNGNVHCVNCLKASIDIEDMEQYIEEFELKADFSDYIKDVDIIRYLRPLYVKAEWKQWYKQRSELYDLFVDFCFEDEEHFLNWYIEGNNA